MFFRRQGRRSLATVLFTDIVGSTDLAARLGDRRWRELLRNHHQVVRKALNRFGGREVDNAGDGFFAVFRQPTDAVRCAEHISEQVHPLGLTLRIGIHTGEIETLGRKVAGIAVVIGSRVMNMAGSDDVLVSSTVHDLVAGSGMDFEEAGTHHLKGVPGEWQLFRLVRAAQPQLEPTPPQDAGRPRPGRAALLVVMGAGAALAAVIVGGQILGLGSTRPEIGPNLLVGLDEALNAAVSTRVRGPEVIVFDGTYLWVASPDEGQVLTRVDPGRPLEAETIGVVGTVIATDGSSVWAANPLAHSITRIDAQTLQLSRTLDLPVISHLVVAAGWLWALDPIAGEVLRLDPDDPSSYTQIQVPPGVQPVSLAWGGDRLWVSARVGSDFAIFWLDSSEASARRGPALIHEPGAMAHDGERLWVASPADDAIRLISAGGDQSPTMGMAIEVCDGPSAIWAEGDAAWIVCRRGREVMRIDSVGQVIARRDLPATPTDVVVVDGLAWVTLRSD